ncbi:ATP-binding protein [bacterium]|nr:ATP-binding protein [bacterium]
MNYSRNILPELLEQINTREIIVLTGMRRVGKTTLLSMVYDRIESSNKVFFDIENIIEQKVFEETDYNNIIANFRDFGVTDKERAFVFLDEIQAMPEIVRPIKYLYDHYDIKFYLTGSSSFYLKNLFPESLSGRKVLFELFPLDFKEFCIFNNLDKPFPRTFQEKAANKRLISAERYKKYHEVYLKYGGFPQVVLAESLKQKEIYLKDIFASYFEKDLRTLSDFKFLNVYRDLILLLMQRVGSKLDITKIASEVGVSRETVYSYLSFLQGTYFVHFISPFSRNVDREVSGTKKVYFCDNGFLTLYGNLSPGNALENAVHNQLKKYGNLNYYQKRSGAEIDFILDQKTAFEVKMNASESRINRLKKISESLGLTSNYLISQKFSDFENVILAQDL